VNDGDEKGFTALQHTATHCNTLQHTATHCNKLQVNDGDEKGFTALHICAFANAVTPCEILLDKGADVNAVTDKVHVSFARVYVSLSWVYGSLLYVTN